MKRLFLHSVAIAVLTVIITLLVNLIMNMWIFHIAFPEQSALKDFEFEDFAFSVLQTREQRDENVILVNIGQLGRAGIAEQINVLSRYNPKVLGVGVFFNCGGYRDTVNCPQLLDTLGNTLLHEAIKNSGKVVLVSRVFQSREAGEQGPSKDSLELSDPMFSDFSRNGFGNLTIPMPAHEDGNKSCRSFTPKWKINDEIIYSFPVAISQMADSVKTNRFLKRNNQEEIINYKGNISVRGSLYPSDTEYFETLEYDDVLHGRFDTTMVRDKVLILGYFGDYLLDNRADEMYYSPLNRIVLGKSLPDMYGMVVNANIISMILREDYINKTSVFNTWLLSFVIVFFNAMLFVWLFQRNTIWYDALTLLIPAFQIVAIAYVRYVLFQRYMCLTFQQPPCCSSVLACQQDCTSGLYK